jgi:hypothetical protein
MGGQYKASLEIRKEIYSKLEEIAGRKLTGEESNFFHGKLYEMIKKQNETVLESLQSYKRSFRLKKIDNLLSRMKNNDKNKERLEKERQKKFDQIKNMTFLDI